MPTKRNVGTGLIEVGNALGGYFQNKARQQAIDQAQQNALDRQDNASANSQLMEILKDSIKSPMDAYRASKAGLHVPPGLIPDASELNSPLSKEIESAKKPEDLLTEQGIRNQYTGSQVDPTIVMGAVKNAVQSQGGGDDSNGADSASPLPSRDITSKGIPDALRNLLAERQAKSAELGQADAKEGVWKTLELADGTKKDFFIPKSQYATYGVTPDQSGGLTVQQNAATQGSNEATKYVAANSPAVQQNKATQAGLNSGAEHKAAFPFENQLDANRQMREQSRQQYMYDYERNHPKATADELNRLAAANSARDQIALVRSELDEMDKRGMIGPIAGRFNELSTGKIKAEQLFKDPNDARLAARFDGDVDLLGKLALKAHLGVRGAASPEQSKQFKANVLSAVGSKSIIQGQLDSLDDIMGVYQKDPNAPTGYVIPGRTDPFKPFPGSVIAPVPGETLGKWNAVTGNTKGKG